LKEGGKDEKGVEMKPLEISPSVLEAIKKEMPSDEKETP
jgi:hypothetical protein